MAFESLQEMALVVAQLLASLWPGCLAWVPLVYQTLACWPVLSQDPVNRTSAYSVAVSVLLALVPVEAPLVVVASSGEDALHESVGYGAVIRVGRILLVSLQLLVAESVQVQAHSLALEAPPSFPLAHCPVLDSQGESLVAEQ